MNYLIWSPYYNDYVSLFELVSSSHRPIDVEKDIYPPPLMTLSSSYQVQNFEKLQYALWYLQPKKLRELIITHQDDYKLLTEKDYNMEYYTKEKIEKMIQTHTYDYGGCTEVLTGDKIDIYSKCTIHYGNLITFLMSGSFSTNIYHEKNEFLFDQLFMSIIQPLHLENIPHMIEDLEMAFGSSYHSHRFLFVLLNFGASLKNVKSFWEKNIKSYQQDVDEKYALYLMGFFQIYENKIQESKYPIGRKLDYLLEETTECVITGLPIQEPVIIEDGSVYEKSAILDWFSRSSLSPMTGISLQKWWILYDWRKNEFVYANNHILFEMDGLK